MPCCWAPTDTAATSSRPPAAPMASLQRGPPRCGIDLGAVGMRRGAERTDLTGVGVADHHLAGLGGRVDSRNECHACEVTPGDGSGHRLGAGAAGVGSGGWGRDAATDEFTRGVMSVPICENS